MVIYFSPPSFNAVRSWYQSPSLQFGKPVPTLCFLMTLNTLTLHDDPMLQLAHLPGQGFRRVLWANKQ